MWCSRLLSFIILSARLVRNLALHALHSVQPIVSIYFSHKSIVFSNCIHHPPKVIFISFSTLAAEILNVTLSRLFRFFSSQRSPSKVRPIRFKDNAIQPPVVSNPVPNIFSCPPVYSEYTSSRTCLGFLMVTKAQTESVPPIFEFFFGLLPSNKSPT